MRQDHAPPGTSEPNTLLTRLVDAVAEFGCALYPTAVSITLMADIERRRQSVRDPGGGPREIMQSEGGDCHRAAFPATVADAAANPKELPMITLITRMLRRPAAHFVARTVVTFPFWVSGFSKLVHFDAGVAEMAHFGLHPAAAFNVATVFVQLAGSLLVILGPHAWIGAGALGLFTGLTIPLVHHFWTMTDEPFRTIALHTASEHVGLIGGLFATAVLSARSSDGERKDEPHTA
jgi:transmembrane protein